MLALRVLLAGPLLLVAGANAMVQYTYSNTGRATVQDLVNCLGNSTRYTIEYEGSGILIKSTPYIDPGGNAGDAAVSDCLIATGIMEAATYVTVPLQELYPTVVGRRSMGDIVPADFIPTSKCAIQDFEVAPSASDTGRANSTDLSARGPLIYYTAYCYGSSGCPYGPGINEYKPGSTDCITKPTGGWKSVQVNNLGGCAVLYARSWVHHNCRVHGTGASAPPYRKVVSANSQACLDRRALSFCAVDKDDKPCLVHSAQSKYYC